MPERYEGLLQACGRGVGAPGHALPGDRPHWPRDRTVAIRHVSIDVTLDIEKKQASGIVTHVVAPFNDGTRAFELDAAEMDIGGVQVAGKRGRYTYDGCKLRINLPRGVKRGEEVEVAVGFRSTPRLGLYFTGPDEGYPTKPVQAWTQNQDEDGKFWFPCYDAPNNKQTSEMIATVPGSWFALSNGELVEERVNDDGTRTFRWKQERPHATYLITLAAGEFERIDASRDGLTIDYFVEPQDRTRGELTFKNTPAMISLFEEVTGIPFPWAKYSQIVVRDFVFGGMENTSATTMTENILLDRKALRDHTSDGLIAHELAHMWWGDLLTCRDWSHGWLNEGFATYAEQLWRERHRGINEYRQGVLEETELYLSEPYRRPVVSNVFNEPIDLFDRHLYEKGGLVLHTLRGVLGDDQFFRSIRRYCRDHQDSSVITQDLVDAIEAETGRNLEWFFDQWVYRPGHPKFDVSWSWDGDKNLASLTVKQTQDDDGAAEAFRVPMTVDFTREGEKPVAFDIEVTEREHTFVFPLPGKPALCRFDPYNRTLKEVSFRKPLGELTYQLAHDDDIAGRRQAAESLGKQASGDAIAALERAVTGDPFWGVAAAAARALGAVRTEQARDALLRCLQVRQLKVKRAVVEALGHFRGDTTVLEALRPIASGDRSYFVEAEANRSIGKLRLAESFDILRTNVSRPSYREVVRAACLDGLCELRDRRGFDVIRESARYGAPQATRAAAVRDLARLANAVDEPPPGIDDEIAEYLDDPDFRVRVSAMNALKALKDPKWAERLDAMAERELDGRAVRSARSAAMALRKGTEQSEEVKRLRQQLEDLREQHGKILTRLERIDAGRAKS